MCERQLFGGDIFRKAVFYVIGNINATQKRRESFASETLCYFLTKVSIGDRIRVTIANRQFPAVKDYTRKAGA